MRPSGAFEQAILVTQAGDSTSADDCEEKLNNVVSKVVDLTGDLIAFERNLFFAAIVILTARA